MSRYGFRTTKDGKDYVVAYGYDRPLQEYFLQVEDPSIEDEDNQLIVWEGSRMTGKSNSEICELFQHWNVPEKHIKMVALDLPF